MRKYFLTAFFLILLHAIPYMAWAAPLEGGYKNGLYIQTSDQKYKFLFNVMLQPQHQFLSIANQNDTNTFQLRRAKLFFSGNAYNPNLTYQFELDVVSGKAFSVTPSESYAGPSIQDAFINYDFGNGIEVKAGQFKVYYNREELVPTSAIQMVDYSMTNEVFSLHRDIGIALHGEIFGKQLEYAVFAMNEGSNRNKSNRNKMFIFGGRFLWNILGHNTYGMSDISYSEDGVTHSSEPQLALAIASNVNKVRPTQTASDNTAVATTWDVAYRYQKFSLVGIGYHFGNTTAGTNTLGFLGEAGYFLIPKHFEVAARYAGVIPTASKVTNGYEAGVGLNYFFKGHRLKIQTDYNILINSPLVYGAGGVAGTDLPANIVTTGGAPGFHQNQKDHQFRTQFQLLL